MRTKDNRQHGTLQNSHSVDTPAPEWSGGGQETQGFVRVYRKVTSRHGPIEYGSITDQISSYILENHAMLKTSNIRVLNIAEDPILQPIFNVNYLHRCQIFSLLRGQLRSGDDFVIKTTKITNSNSSIIRIDRALADLGLGMDTEPVEASPQTHDLVTKIQ